jgi:hypothetical protein
MIDTLKAGSEVAGPARMNQTMLSWMKAASEGPREEKPDGCTEKWPNR